MTKRKKSSFFKLETIILSVFVLSFFIWALSKAKIGERLSSLFEKEDTTEIGVVPVDSLQQVLQELRPIYVTIDNLNMREEPTLKSSVIRRLPLYEKVFFTGVLTDTTTKVNIGKVTADEPWVRVKLEDGTEGWLYGAGVQFFKTENPNVISN